MIKCQHCGRQIPYDANLCPYCGRSIKTFQQKDVLENDTPADEPQPVMEEDRTNRRPKMANDRKLLFFIIAVLALLLIVGAIYHYSSNGYVETVPRDTLTNDTTAIAAQTEGEKAQPQKVAYNPKKSQRVVVNGEGVRLRFGPSLKAEYLKDEKGATRSVKKGTQLECVGEKGDWYHVVYLDKHYYISKQYSYLVE